MRAPWPFHVSALPRRGAGVRLAVEVVRWRIGGNLNLTVVAKATLSLVHQGTARLEAPAELVRRDRHWDLDPARSVEAASDLAPFRKNADVTLFGHAYNPPGRLRPATSVRLGVFGQRPLLVKTVQVFGDRVGAGPGAVRPFQQMPLVYERALKSADNPLGIDAPNLVDAADRSKPVAFGPVPSYWLQRRRALGALPREALEADVLELPEGFDWSFFQAAPPDQQIAYLAGDEWIVLDGMHPALPRFQSRLPSAVVSARVHGAGAGPGYPVEMVADGLAIDADRQTCTVTWRRSFPVDSEEAASTLRILVGLALPDDPVAWPDLPARVAEDAGARAEVGAQAAAPAASEAPEAPATSEQTRAVDVSSLGIGGGLPFAALRDDLDLPGPAAPAAAAATRPDSGSTSVFSVASLGVTLPFQRPGGRAGEPARISHQALPPLFDDETTTDAKPEAARTLPFMKASKVPLPPPPVEPPPVGFPAATPPPAAPSPVAVPQTLAPPAPPEGWTDMPIPEGTVEISALMLAGAGLPFGPAPVQPFSPRVNPAPPASYAGPSGLPFSAPYAATPFSPASPSSGPVPAPPASWPGQAPAPPASWPGQAPAPPASWPGETPPAPARPARPAAQKAPAGAITKPPPRVTPEVPVTNPTPLALVTLPWQVKPPQDVLVVVVKGTFDLDADGPIRLRRESDPPVGDLHVDDDPQKSAIYPSDFAIFKPRADVTLTGHACAPGGLAAAARVTFRFGAGTNRFDRIVNVFGDRRWRPGLVANGVTDPTPFKRIPLVWEKAFGGPRFDRNPVGAGHAGQAQGKGAGDAAQGVTLPNLEDPARGISAPADTPDPACFAPISTAWKERWSKLGTYDARWLKARWPFFPDDFDWAHFQAAPSAQRLDHLKGDEPFELVGVHASYPAIRGRLSGLRPRCFLHRTEEAGGAFEEILLKLDTAAFDADEMKVNLVWRGVIEVSEDEAPELAALFLMTEEAGEKAATLAQARERFMGALAPRKPVAAEPEDEVTVAANDADVVREDDVAAAIEADGKKREAVLSEALAAAGMADGPVGAPPPAPDPQAIAETLRKGGASDEEVERLLEALRPETPVSEPVVDARARVIRKLAAGESFEGEDLAGVDLSALDFTGRTLAGANLKEARLVSAVLQRADLSGAQMSGADLTDANLGEANLTGADLQGATLAQANLAGACVQQANFGAAAADRACFWGARGGQASFDGARLSKADFREAELPAADFSGAEIGGAVFEKAKLESVRLFGAQAAGAKFDQAKMAGARADGGVFPAASFRAVEAPESVWERADLTGATLQGAQLAGASFSRIKGQGANFSGAELRESKFRRAKLMEARFLKANLMTATFERADLTNADMRGANLHSAETLNARLGGVKLDLAIVTKSKLKGRS